MSKDSIIKAFEGVNVRIVWDAETEEYYFSVNDIVQVLTESADPKDYIKKMLKRDPELKSRWGTICPPVRMLAPDGVSYLLTASRYRLSPWDGGKGDFKGRLINDSTLKS